MVNAFREQVDTQLWKGDLGMSRREAIMGIGIWITAILTSWAGLFILDEAKKKKERIDLDISILKSLPVSKSVFREWLKIYWVPSTKIENILRSIVSIQTTTWRGTGFFIGKNQILTAFHVMQGQDIYRIYDLEWNKYSPEIFMPGGKKNDLWCIITRESWEWFLNPYQESSLDDWDSYGSENERITLWFWWGQAHPTNWERITSFNGENIQAKPMEDMWLIDIKLLSNPIKLGDSWWPVLNIDWELEWVTVLRWDKPYTEIGKDWIEIDNKIHMWGYEPIGDIRDFLDTIGGVT